MYISDLSDITGASSRMLRHYEKAGLLTPTRDPNGYRRYRKEDVQTVEDIRCLLASGLSLSESAFILRVACADPDEATDEERREALRQLDEREDQLADAMRRLRAQRAGISELRTHVRDAMKALTSPDQLSGLSSARR